MCPEFSGKLEPKSSTFRRNPLNRVIVISGAFPDCATGERREKVKKKTFLPSYLRFGEIGWSVLTLANIFIRVWILRVERSLSGEYLLLTLVQNDFQLKDIFRILVQWFTVDRWWAEWHLGEWGLENNIQVKDNHQNDIKQNGNHQNDIKQNGVSELGAMVFIVSGLFKHFSTGRSSAKCRGAALPSKTKESDQNTFRLIMAEYKLRRKKVLSHLPQNEDEMVPIYKTYFLRHWRRVCVWQVFSTTIVYASKAEAYPSGGESYGGLLYRLCPNRTLKF